MTKDATGDTEQTDQDKQAERDKALKKAYQTATSRLRDQRRTEFHALYTEAAKELGVEWTPPKTAEQKAAEEMDRLLQTFPQLRERITEEAPEEAPDEEGATT